MCVQLFMTERDVIVTGVLPKLNGGSAKNWQALILDTSQLFVSWRGCAAPPRLRPLDTAVV